MVEADVLEDFEDGEAFSAAPPASSREGVDCTEETLEAPSPLLDSTREGDPFSWSGGDLVGGSSSEAVPGGGDSGTLVSLSSLESMVAR